MRCQGAVVAVLGLGRALSVGSQSSRCDTGVGTATAVLFPSFGLQEEALLQDDKESIYFVTRGAVLLSWECQGGEEKGQATGRSQYQKILEILSLQYLGF